MTSIAPLIQRELDDCTTVCFSSCSNGDLDSMSESKTIDFECGDCGMENLESPLLIQVKNGKVAGIVVVCKICQVKYHVTKEGLVKLA